MSEYLINGKIAELVSIQDRGFHYGDGVFETLVARKGKLQFWNEHVLRLVSGCARLKITLPDLSLLESEAHQLLNLQQAVNTSDYVVKIIVTRGIGKRGYKPPKDAETTRVIAVYPYPRYPSNYYTDGVRIAVCATSLTCNPALAGIKHLNRLEQVLAQAEWENADIVDGIMINNEQGVIECTMSNIFWATGNQIFTPDLSRCGVEGVTRAQILRLAKELQLKTIIGNFQLKDVLEAEEVMISNSVFGIFPVKQIDEFQKSVGPVVRKLADAYTTITRQNES